MKVYLTFNNIKENELSLIQRSEAILGELGFSFKRKYNENSNTRTWEMIPSKRNPMSFMFSFSLDEMMEIKNTPFSEISSKENPPLSIDLSNKKPITIKQLKKIFPTEMIEQIQDIKELLKISNTFRQINIVLLESSKIEDPVELKKKEKEIKRYVNIIKKLITQFKDNEHLFKIIKELWLDNIIKKGDVLFTNNINKTDIDEIENELKGMDFSDNEIEDNSDDDSDDDDDDYLSEEEIEERRKKTIYKIVKSKSVENKFYRLSFIVRSLLEYIEDEEMSQIIMDTMTFDDEDNNENLEQ